jgi:hypothetical protein
MTETDINHYKKSLNHVVWVDQSFAEYEHLISTLITTIESQKAEIKCYKDITELAVKELKEIHVQAPWGLRAHIRQVLDEIERLSHD